MKQTKEIKAPRTGRKNSITAFNEIKEKLPKRRDKVYAYIQDHPNQTAEMIMIGMGYRSINYVAPRITELLHGDEDNEIPPRIKISGRAKTSSGHTANTFVAIEDDE